MSKILNIQGSEVDDMGVLRLMDYVRYNLPDDFTLIVGCTPYVNDIDGVLIGKGNIYAVECKNWKGNIEATDYNKWLKDGSPIENPLHQTRNNAVALAKWLRSKTGNYDKIWVKGVLVFTHDKCYLIDKREGDSNTGVKITMIDELGKWIMEQKEQINNETTKKITELFEEVEGEKTKEKHLYKEDAEWASSLYIISNLLIWAIFISAIFIIAEWKITMLIIIPLVLGILAYVCRKLVKNSGWTPHYLKKTNNSSDEKNPETHRGLKVDFFRDYGDHNIPFHIDDDFKEW